MKSIAKAMGWGVLTVVLLFAGVGGSRMARQRLAQMRRYRPPVTASFVKDFRAFAAGGIARGPDTALVRVVVFTDYRCPACRQLIPLMDSLLIRHPDIQLTERMFADDGYVGGERLPQAVYCSQAMGRESEFRFRVQRTIVDLQDDLWGAIGARAGIIDTSEFVRCLNSNKFDSIVLADRAAAHSLKIVYPPAILINDSLYLSVPLSLSQINARIPTLREKLR